MKNPIEHRRDVKRRCIFHSWAIIAKRFFSVKIQGFRKLMPEPLCVTSKTVSLDV